MITRRNLLKGAVAGLVGSGMILHRAADAGEPATTKRIRIGSCRIGLRAAKLAGLDGVEIGVGNPADKLSVADPEVRRRYKAEMAETGLPISSLMMGLFNANPLAEDPRAPAWLEQSIDAAKDLGAGVILVAFFGKGNLLEDGKLKEAKVEVAVQRLKAAAPRARDAGVILAIENTLSAQQNIEMLERIAHPAVRVYYDVGNSTRYGYDVPAEIRHLKDRIACIHFKDGGSHLGQGQVQFVPIATAIQAIGYRGWIVMEMGSSSKEGTADAKRNADYIRKLFGMS